MRKLAALFPLMCSLAWANVYISTATLPNGTVGTVYSANVYAKNGCTPYRWTWTALPAGITAAKSIDTRTLNLRGTPTTAAIYNFTITVTGCGNHGYSKSYQVVMAPAVIASSHTVRLSWIASTSANVAGYNVYRSTDQAIWVKVNSGLIASTLYTDTPGDHQTYYYEATAVDTSNVESVRSVPVTALVP